MIKYASIEYFTLLDLRDKLLYRDYDKLDLISLDRLRNEVETKILQIHTQHNEQKHKTESP